MYLTIQSGPSQCVGNLRDVLLLPRDKKFDFDHFYQYLSKKNLIISRQDDERRRHLELALKETFILNK